VITKSVVWRKDAEGNMKAYGPDGLEATWAATPGGQEEFLNCPLFETILVGPRGTGKTDALLMDFAQHVGQGWGVEWRGILFRQSFPQLRDVIAKSKKWFPLLFPGAGYNESKHFWKFPQGEELHFSFMDRSEDYWNYHGHAYPWIAFEELTTWPDASCYTVMMACSRSTVIGIPRKYRATSNPYGPGHNWVKSRFRLPVPHGRYIGRIVKTPGQPNRVAIDSKLRDNLPLMAAEPDYIQKIAAAARNPAELEAWIEGSWDIIAGGMFDDIWSPAHHIVPDIPFDMIPSRWRLNRSYDHGQSKPFSVGFWAQSNGEPVDLGNGVILGRVRGDLFRVAEWYGCRSGAENEGIRMLAIEIAEGIRDREARWGLKSVKPGPADSSIFDDFEPGKSVAGDMSKRGIRWEPADKGPGSRAHGWEQMRKYLKAAIPGPEGVREAPGLFICRRCEDFIRTIPVLPRDDKKLDDVDTDAEDHIADEVRYRLREKVRKAGTRSF
jgi:hypothetical protein